jgi:hypothetical protein
VSFNARFEPIVLPYQVLRKRNARLRIPVEKMITAMKSGGTVPS